MYPQMQITRIPISTILEISKLQCDLKSPQILFIDFRDTKVDQYIFETLFSRWERYLFINIKMTIR